MQKYHLAYSGSRFGMTLQQKDYLISFLATMIQGSEIEKIILHHGVCVGGDTEADEIARALGLKIWFHPSIKTDWTNPELLKMPCEGIDAAYSYSGRNQRMVLACDFLIATPKNMIKHGGTWNAISHARAAKKNYIVVDQRGDPHANV